MGLQGGGVLAASDVVVPDVDVPGPLERVDASVGSTDGLADAAGRANVRGLYRTRS